MFDSAKVWAYVIVTGVAVGASALGGYKVGEWKQASADETKVTDATNALAKNAKDVAEAEKRARADAAAEYESQIKQLKDRATWAEQLDADLQKTNTTLAGKLYDAQQAVAKARRAPSTDALLSTPLPADLRDGVRDAINGPRNDVSGGADHRPR